jgi:hypothetical protein
MRTPTRSFFSMACPHCKAKARVNASREQSTMVRLLVFSCTNFECGHVFTALLSVEKTLSPSAIPDGDLNIPLSPHIRGEILRRQIDMFQPKEETP